MPSKSAAQAKLMRAAAHSAKFAAQIGISQDVAREWWLEDKKLEEAGEASYESLQLMDSVIDFHTTLESLQAQGLVLHTRGEVTDNELDAFKTISNRLLEPAGFNVDGPETISSVDASTDLELTLEHLQTIKNATERTIFKEAQMSDTLSFESFQEIFSGVHIPKSTAISAAPSTSVMLTPSARGSGQPADANALRWIEANHNLNSLKVMVRMIRSSQNLQGDEFDAAKRLLKQLMTSAGFYLDNIEYAHTLDELESILDEAIGSVATQVSMTWSPGMPGYGIK